MVLISSSAVIAHPACMIDEESVVFNYRKKDRSGVDRPDTYHLAYDQVIDRCCLDFCLASNLSVLLAHKPLITRLVLHVCCFLSFPLFSISCVPLFILVLLCDKIE